MAVGTLNLGLGPTRFPLQWTRFLLQYALMPTAVENDAGSGKRSLKSTCEFE
jgi:hypothetical protein